MAKKSKTQRAKASAVRAEKKEQAKIAESQVEAEPQETKKGFFEQRKETREQEKAAAAAQKAKEQKKQPKKERFLFFKGVKSELKRVTWPTRQDVLRWSVVVVVALVFFGVFVALLDNVIITPLLVAVSGLGA